MIDYDSGGLAAYANPIRLLVFTILRVPNLKSGALAMFKYEMQSASWTTSEGHTRWQLSTEP